MKRTLILLGALSVGTAYSQSHKVGINTDNPRASLEVSKAAGIAATEVQGFILPQLTQAERNTMDQSQFVQGLQIYNTDKKCVDIWTGTHWQCIDGTKQDNQGDTPSTPSAVYAITQLGFGGVYKADEALTSDNTVTFKIKNTGAVTSPTMYLSNAVTITNEPGGSVSVVGGQHTSITIAPGREVTLTYRLQGTPKAGNLKAKLTYNTVYDEAITPVVVEVDPIVPQYVTLGGGERSFVSVYDADYWPYTGPSTVTAQTTPEYVDGNLEDIEVDIQGKIPTTGVEVYIPITIDPAVGHQPINVSAFPGSELPVSANYTEDGVSRNIKLSWEAQTIHVTDTYIKAKISAVGQDLLLKKLDFNSGMGKDYMGIVIGTFRYTTTQGGTQKESFTVRLMSGIPDRRFGIKTNGVYEHQFIYVPIKEPKGGYIWLNNNLGAEYTRYGSSDFDPGQQAKTPKDWLAFGSMFQFGRPADGHELVTYTNATAYTFKHGISNTPATTYPNVGHGQTIKPATTYDGSGKINTPNWFGNLNTINYVTLGNDNDYSVCPVGFKVPEQSQIFYYQTSSYRTKAYGITDFVLRLPTNATESSSVRRYGSYYYSPILWVNTNGIYQESNAASAYSRTSFNIALAQTTHVPWDATSGSFIRTNGTCPTCINYDNNRFWPYGSDPLMNGYQQHSGQWNSYGTGISVNHSLPIRCVKQ